MSSWVTPAVAANMWGMSLERVLSGIADGSIKTKMQGQLLMVDANSSPEVRFKGRFSENELPPALPDPFPVTLEELQALNSVPTDYSAMPLDLPELECLHGVEEETRVDVSQWRTARQQTAQSRRPPVSGAV